MLLATIMKKVPVLRFRSRQSRVSCNLFWGTYCRMDAYCTPSIRNSTNYILRQVPHYVRTCLCHNRWQWDICWNAIGFTHAIFYVEWSDNKHHSTAKFLVACTPNGAIYMLCVACVCRINFRCRTYRYVWFPWENWRQTHHGWQRHDKEFRIYLNIPPCLEAVLHYPLKKWMKEGKLHLFVFPWSEQ